MFTSKITKIVVNILIILFVENIFADDVFDGVSPQLGVIISDDYVEQVDFVVMPSGEGLPKGSGDALAGKVLYNIHCMACHGPDAKGGINGDLAGGHGTISGPIPKKTVGSYWPYATIIFDYIRRAMPYQSPGTLSNNEVYALTAYILNLNGVIGEDELMTAQTLPKAKMPNSEGFIWAYSPSE